MNILNVTQERQILCCSQLAQLPKVRAMHSSEASGPKWGLKRKKNTIAQHWNSAFAEHLNISSVAPPNDALCNALIYKQKSNFNYHPWSGRDNLACAWWGCSLNTQVLQSWELLLLSIRASCLRFPGRIGIWIPNDMRLTISESLNSPGSSEKDNLNITQNVILSTQCWKAASFPARHVSLWGSVQCF